MTSLFRVDGPWPGRLWISARPRGGDWLGDEMKAWRNAGIDLVVSLLEPAEAADLDLDQEEMESKSNNIEYRSLPIADRGVPASSARTQALISDIESALKRGKSIVIHCRQGVGRAGLIAAAVLIQEGASPDRAVERLTSARGVPVPETLEQKRWLDSYAPATAGR